MFNDDDDEQDGHDCVNCGSPCDCGGTEDWCDYCIDCESDIEEDDDPDDFGS